MGWNPTNMLINMHDPTLREVQDHIIEKLRELANRARAARGTPGDCLLLLGCNQGRHRSPMIRHLTTRWMEETHGMDVDSSDIDNVHWQCVECNLYRENATRQACVAWFKNEMDLAIEFATRATWATANELAWLGFRDLSLEVIPASPPLPPIPAGSFHRIRDNSQDPRSRSRGISGGVSLVRGESRPPQRGRSGTPEKGTGKGDFQETPPNLVNVGKWNRAQQAQAGGKGAARPVTLHPAPSHAPASASHTPPVVANTGTQAAPIEVDPAPGDVDRAALVVDVEAIEQPVDASVDEASIVYSLNLLRQVLLNNELTDEQSRHLRQLSLSTRSQTVGLWDCGTQTSDYGPTGLDTARQSPTNPCTNPLQSGSGASRRNKMPTAPTARQSGEASSTTAGDAVREVPVQAAPTARRQGSRPPHKFQQQQQQQQQQQRIVATEDPPRQAVGG